MPTSRIPPGVTSGAYLDLFDGTECPITSFYECKDCAMSPETKMLRLHLRDEGDFEEYKYGSAKNEGEGKDNTYAFTKTTGEIIMEGDFVHAVDMGGKGGVTVGDAEFQACNPHDRKNGDNFVKCPGDDYVYVKAANMIPSWGSCNGCTDDTNMNQVLGSILWTPWSRSFDVQIKELNPNFEYELQLFFVEQCCDRGFYIYVDGERQADINPKRLAGMHKPSVFVHSVIPSSTKMTRKVRE